jgi:hypothetical protein
VLVRAVAIADHRCKPLAVLDSDKNTEILSHTPRIAHLRPAVNPAFVSVH